MRKCRACKNQEAEWAWQPLGPAKSPRETFVILGWHYCGFPVLPVCGPCKDLIQTGATIRFNRKPRGEDRQFFRVEGEEVIRESYPLSLSK